MNKQAPIRLASYNIRKCIGLDRRRRPERIIEVINGLDADIVALQEADRRMGERPAALSARLIEDETDFHAIPTGQDGPSLGWHGNAILVRKGLDATDTAVMDLPGTEPRGAIAVTVADSVRVVATHLGLRRSDRRRQSLALAAALESTSIPSLIAGDLNEWSPTRGLEPLQEQYQLFSPGRSFHAARPVAALDRIALSHDLSLSDAGVTETKTTRIASDHLPIWATINLPDRRPAD